MFVRSKKKTEDRWQVQIVESYRVGKKVTQKIVRNVGTAHSEKELEDFKALAKKIIIEMEAAEKPVLAFADPADFYSPDLKAKAKQVKTDTVDLSELKEIQRLNEGFDLVLKPLLQEFGFSVNKSSLNPVIESLVLARAFQPSSKLRSHKLLQKYFNIDIPLHHIYESMDYLADNEINIKKKIASKTFDLFNNKVDIMFFDVTTLYFESTRSDELKDFGFSKDCKFKEVQVVLAMVTTTDGMPITYKLFPGNQFEGNTLVPVINELKSEFKIENVFLAADRGMFNEENLKEMDKHNIKYVVGAKLKSLPKATKSQILSPEAKPDIFNDELIWLKELEHKNRRLIISYSPKRARKDSADRKRLIDRLFKKVKDGKIPVKKIVNNYGTNKFIDVDQKTEIRINESKIKEEAEWDGLYGLITNSKKNSTEIIHRYRQLWQIEEAFRVNKSTLKMRPIYHWTSNRIRGHIVLCFITYALIKQVNYKLKKAGSTISTIDFLDELKDVQASIYEHKTSKKQYKMPSAISSKAEEIFKVFGIKYKSSVTCISGSV